MPTSPGAHATESSTASAARPDAQLGVLLGASCGGVRLHAVIGDLVAAGFDVDAVVEVDHGAADAVTILHHLDVALVGTAAASARAATAVLIHDCWSICGRKGRYLTPDGTTRRYGCSAPSTRSPPDSTGYRSAHAGYRRR